MKKYRVLSFFTFLAAALSISACCRNTQNTASTTSNSFPVQQEIASALESVCADSISIYIDQIVAFQTRHNLSTVTDSLIGRGAALRYLEKRCRFWAETARNRPAPIVEVIDYPAGGEGTRLIRPVVLQNLMVTLPGNSADGEIIMLAHYDSRAADNTDSTIFAPGANDNGSGVSCLLETVRILSQISLEKTVKCIFLSGEEHGLLGAAYMANTAVQENWPVWAVINNDMIGNALSSGTNLETTSMVRVFSDSPRGSDSPSRQWARYIKETATAYLPSHEVKLIFRNDRYGRGGDHTPFLKAGFTAVRMSEYYENYDRTHQNVREENGIAYGDIPSGVNIPYLVNNIKVNLASVMNLASAPAIPQNACIANAKALSNYTIIEWDPILINGGTTPDTSITYQVMLRETDSPVWEEFYNCPASSDSLKQKMQLPLSKDNYIFAVRALSQKGNPGLPAVCR